MEGLPVGGPFRLSDQRSEALGGDGVAADVPAAQGEGRRRLAAEPAQRGRDAEALDHERVEAEVKDGGGAGAIGGVGDAQAEGEAVAAGAAGDFPSS